MLPVTDRLVYADALRALATVAVITLHVAAGYLGQFDQLPRDQWWTAHVFDAGTRWCVPVFLMLSGSLLLRPSKLTPGLFLWRRTTRVFIPFLIWSAVYLVDEYAVFIVNNGYVPWGNVLSQLAGGRVQYHLWFVYLILSLYLIAPVLRTFVQHATAADLRYYLLLWVMINALSGVMRVLKVYHLIPEGEYVLSYLELTGYAGYFILGWAMGTGVINWPARGYAALLAVGFSVTLLGTFAMTRYANGFIEMLYEYLQPNVMLMAVGVFGLVQRAFSRTGRVSLAVSPFLADFTKLSFGIYLVHVLVLNQLSKDLLSRPLNGVTLWGQPVHPLLGIPVTVFTCLLISYAVIKLLSFVPRLRNWVM